MTPTEAEVRVGRHLAEQRGKSVAQLAKEYRRYAERIDGQRYRATDPAEKLIVLFIALDTLGAEASPRERREFRDAFRHIAAGTLPLMPTEFRAENTPIYLLVLAKLMGISRDGTLLDPEDAA